MNIEKVKEKIYYQGFDKDLYPELDKQIADGVTDITLVKTLKIDDIEVDYRLNINNDIDKGELYFNNWDIYFKKSGGEEIEHTFSTNRMITAMEGFRMAFYGDKVSVYKTLYKDDAPYNTWLSLAIDKPKDDFGNYLYNSFHQNYYQDKPFDLKNELKDFTHQVKELEEPKNIARFERDLKKAKLPVVTILTGGHEVQGFLGINPAKGEVVLYDVNFNLIETKAQEIKSKQLDEPNPDKDEKKKSPGLSE